ncbi:hypothetical protein [Pseudomarimonas arenosa]|uniref:Uncharacterized protein n=1 Tax=Pseudomarimonas arenosa TaxID=2774145 RepID=A0AAW3ZNH3_9GAMM|nr:hypothetical protein [Pseudomarimonas arenosa]MBD8526722.1 hypothetical protein [Pseudomarimonas arenosa]
MDWFSALWLTALAIALLSGKAYFRGVVERQYDPGQYWTICACYVVLAGMIPVLRAIKG